MKLLKKKSNKYILILFLILFSTGILFYCTKPRSIVLEFGMFTGSNWNVANANSFVIIDNAIARFEAEHPGVKVHYYSGVPKDEYSEWLSRKILAGEEPDVFMVLGSDFDQFSSIGIMKNLEELIAADESFDTVKYIRQLNELYQGQKVARENFNEGTVAFMPLTFAEYRTYKTYPYKIKRYANFKWDCIAMPAGMNGDNVSQVDTLLMGISENTRKQELAWEFLKLLTYDEEIQTQIFSHSQGASVLRAVTQSAEMEAIVQAEMEEGETVISGKLLGKVIEEGYTAPQFKKYEQALALTNSEIGEILENDATIESNMKILQRTINSYLQQ